MAKPSGNRLMLTALFDQGAVSCGNFLTNILLARSLAADQYGVFALFLDAILFLNSLQAALLIYPLTVRCPLLDDRQLRRCAGTCVLLTLLIAIPLGLALAGYGMFIGAGSVALWAVLGQTFWQCQETLRRTMLARRSYSRAILGDCVSYLGQVIIIALLVMGNKADVPRAFMAMAITSLIAAIIQGFQIGLLPTAPRAAMEMGKSFWFIGRWVMVSNLTNVLTSVCCTFTLARSHHNAAVGQYAAVSNLLRIANPLFITLATLIVPAVALAAAGGHNHRTLSAAWRVSRHYGVRGAALLVPYWLVLMVFPGKALAIFYHGRPEYLGLETDLRLFVCISIFTMINAVVASFFNGLHRSRRAMVAQFVGAGACVVVTIPLTIKFGLEGLLVGTLLSNAVIAMALVYLYHLLSREFADTSESPSLTSATSPPVAAPVV
jgi:O-antigen/teichoic acid export membrane protein